MKTYVITGASSGIGRALSIHLAKEGVCLHLIGRNTDSLESCKNLCLLNGSTDITIHQLDLSDRNSVVNWINNWPQIKINGLFHCAGVNHRVPIDRVDYSKWDELMQINLLSPMYITSGLTSYLKEESSVLFLGSRASTLPQSEKEAYCASKAGLDAFCRAYRISVQSRGIKATMIRLGWVDTPLGRRGTSAEMWNMEEFMNPKDVCDVVDYLLACSSLACSSEIVLENQKDPRRFVEDEGSLMSLCQRYYEKGKRDESSRKF